MRRRMSIRQRLILQMVLTGGLLITLGIFFVSGQVHLAQTLRNAQEKNVQPALELRTLRDGIISVHRRMQAVRLSQSTTAAALLELSLYRGQIENAWSAYQDSHIGFPVSDDEALLTESVDAGLDSFWLFMNRLQAAYTIYDPVELEYLATVEWYDLELSLLFSLRELGDLEISNALDSIEDLRTQQRQIFWGVSLILLAVIVVLVFTASRLMRYVNKRIEEITRALESVAAGNLHTLTPGAGEGDMGRIAQALNQTLEKLRADRNAITLLLEQNRAILASMADGVYGVDADSRIVFVNDAACRLLGYEAAHLIGLPSHETLHHHRADGSHYPAQDCPMRASVNAGETVQRDDEVFFRADGLAIPVEYTSAPMPLPNGAHGAIMVFRDISKRLAAERERDAMMQQLRKTNEQLASAQSQLMQSEKMAAVGQLAAGVAHEINNPVGFVSSNLTTLKDYCERLLALVAAYDAQLAALPPDANRQQALEQAREDADLGYLREDLADLLRESAEGLGRVKKIVADLKGFSHVDRAEWLDVDLNAGLESTLNVVWNELKYKADVVREYGELPYVRCMPGQINQVVMNLLVNAAHAMPANGPRGHITLRTRLGGEANEFAIITVADDGCGMPPEIKTRIFEPFFTTKPVGQGTGLGLSIAWDIVRKHQGELSVDSTPGEGTTFTLKLPLAGPRTASSPPPTTEEPEARP